MNKELVEVDFKLFKKACERYYSNKDSARKACYRVKQSKEIQINTCLLYTSYNIVDMLIVGRALGAGALAAVGSAYSLMTFLTSVLIGMCMGSGSLFSYSIGKRDTARLQYEMTASFSFIGIVTIVMNIVVFVCMKPILNILQIPEDIYGMMQEYVWYIFWGIFFVFLYNYFSFLLRAAGDSVVSLVFLGISSGLNIVLDLALVYGCLLYTSRCV